MNEQTRIYADEDEPWWDDGGVPLPVLLRGAVAPIVAVVLIGWAVSRVV